MINFEWIVFFIIIAALVYTAWVIRNEKKNFLKNPNLIKLGPFNLSLPAWWSLVEEKKDCLKFQRNDSKYDWSSTFSLIRSLEEDFSLETNIVEFIKRKNILFDPESSEINERINLNNLEMIRVGGTATEKDFERIYYDVAIFKVNNDILICESKSSVLNGLVEGPYFEEVIKRIST